MDEVAAFLLDLKQMVPSRTREVGPKTMVSLWFNSHKNLATMNDSLRGVKDELNKKPYKFHGQLVKARLEISHHKKRLAKAHALLYKRAENSEGRRVQN